MVFLRKVSIKEDSYFYLYHTYLTKDGSFKKFKRYIGLQKPTEKQLANMKIKFLNDIKNNPDKFEDEKRRNVIRVLQDIQLKEQYISKETIVKLSKELGLHGSELYGVLTFYSQFKLTKPGKYRISICRGTACHVKNSESLLRYLEKELKIQEGKTTEDGKFSLTSVNCIGACASAPAMMINGTVYGELDEKKIKSIIDGFE